MSTDLNNLNQLLADYIDNPNNAEINFKLALYYHSINQTASAVSFYLRTAERTENKLLTYECLLRTAMCFDKQGCRSTSVEGMIQHAVSIMPKRPEAYFHLSRFYERTEKYFLGYMISSVGIEVAERNPKDKLITKIDYPGFWSIQFEKAVCSWWCGLCEESKDTFLNLLYTEPLDKIHLNSVIDNLKKLNAWVEEDKLPTFYKTKEEELMNSVYELDIYLSKFVNRLKYKFKGHDIIQRNYSETWQDIFVLTLLNGKRNGTYLEIGSGYPIFANNTYLLEKDFSWYGISIDNQSKFTQKHFLSREHRAFCMDADNINYQTMFSDCEMSMEIDYLQIDCGDSDTSLIVLFKVIDSGICPSIITFSHDNYKDISRLNKIKARQYLQNKGYELLVSNVSHQDNDDYEDWFIEPNRVSKDIVAKIKNDDDSIKNANKIFFI
jgi:hypothetical protein